MGKDTTPWNAEGNDNNDGFFTEIDGEKLARQVSALEEAGFHSPYSFSSRSLIQATFPHSYRIDAIGNSLVLENGDATISMYSSEGLPYGHYPRLIMMWITREALRRNAMGLSREEARTIPLGDNLARFMREIGVLTPKKKLSGNQIRGLQIHLERLLSTTITIKYRKDTATHYHRSWQNVSISSSGYLWWDRARPDPAEIALPSSYIKLSDEFFLDVTQHAVPIHNLHLKAIKTSPLALDLYTWATYRLATHFGFTRITWAQVKGQIGSSYPDTSQGMRNFRKKVREALEKIKTVWPDMGVVEWTGGIELRGKNPAVPKKDTWFPNDEPPRF